jgi:hypothetical protein
VSTSWWTRLEDAFRPPRRRARRPRPPARTNAASVRRHPVYGGQAHRDQNYPAYMVGFTLIILLLVGFLYVGLNWAADNTRTAALVAEPTAAPAVVVPTPAPPVAAPSPSPVSDFQTYVVKSGDTPVAIAQQFHIKVNDLLKANNITDPRSLQVGQTLRIPSPGGG